VTVQSQLCRTLKFSWKTSHWCRVKTQFYQVIRAEPALAVYRLKVFQISSDVKLTPDLKVNLKLFRCNGKCQQHNVTYVGKCFSFCKCWGHWHYRLFAICFLDKAHVNKLKLNWISSPSIYSELKHLCILKKTSSGWARIARSVVRNRRVRLLRGASRDFQRPRALWAFYVMESLINTLPKIHLFLQLK